MMQNFQPRGYQKWLPQNRRSNLLNEKYMYYKTEQFQNEIVLTKIRSKVRKQVIQKMLSQLMSELINSRIN